MYTGCGNVQWCGEDGKQQGDQKIKNGTKYDLEIPFLDIYPKDVKSLSIDQLIKKKDKWMNIQWNVIQS